MDTNVKKFKYSVSNKILCVVLSVLCFTGSVSLGALAVISTEYLNGFEDNEVNSSVDFTESNEFFNVHYDLYEAVSYLHERENSDKLKNLLASKKDETVEKAYKSYLNWQSKTNPITQDSEEYSTEEGTETTTFVDGNEISAFVASFENSDYYFSFDPNVVRDNSDYNSVNYKDEIAEMYNQFVQDEVYNYDIFTTEYYPNQYCNSLNIAVKYKDYSVGNGEFSKEKVLASSIYIYYDKGEFLYGGLSEEKANSIIEDCVDKNSNETAVCLYFNDFPNMEKLLFTPKYWNDKYASLKAIHSTALDFQDNRSLIIVSVVVLMAVSFISGFYFFMITGRKKQGEKAKLIFIDKLPLEIHFIIIGAVLVLLAYLFLNITAFVTLLSPLTIIFSGLIAFAVCAVLFEFCSSVARLIHSDRKIGKNFAVVRMSKWFVRLCRKIKKGIKQCVLNVVKTVAYKPRQLKAYTFAIVGGYVFINCILILLLISVRDDGSVFAFIGSVFFILNAAVIWYVLKFMKYLDEIISSAKNGEAFKGNREKLPGVLKVLVESLENTNEQLKIAVDKAVKDERLKTELITNVSHDLKTPLTSIISYVDLLSKCDIKDEKAKEYIGVLEDKGAKLKRLIEDLIEASKVTSGNITVNPTSLNLNELCLQAIGENQTEFEKNGLEIIADENEKVPVIFADGSKTFRIFENLLSNARKYSAQPSRVYVSTYVEGNMGVFEIKNISAEPLNISPDELTERFVRGDKSRTKEGNGLGLSIAKELCSAQGGKLEIIIDGDLFKARVKLPLAK